ncbi:MAG: hypothetical protein Q4C81_09745 [Kocuria sp.]|nr:hypothetical protein [Kocuria sp.]
MIKRILFLIAMMGVPVLTTLSTQQLARTTEPPELPASPAVSRVEVETVTPQQPGEVNTSPKPQPLQEPQKGSTASVAPERVSTDDEFIEFEDDE